ncbi:SHOCT domain-containing protein [Marinobacterium rhizophilum]|uniref:SHOCT domain-containing protein n=1 Tax=Marinobacterium rhizophilum TaxID=420402 RepID=UPI00037BE284|nr:SHOCT domain-containing protein [Marinobacterium rhizophilum]
MFQDYDGMMFGHGWGMLLWLLLLLLVLWAFVRLLLGRDSSDRSRQKTARDILDERFASGEIDEDEYRNRLKVLKEEDRD